MAKVGNKVHQKGGPTTVIEGAGLGKGLKWKFPKEKKFWDRWSTEKYGGIKALMGKQIGGQIPMKGPDILKFIKKHDSDNSSGAVKKGLDISQKLQDQATKSKDLMSSIKPLQEILGGSLYGSMKAAGGAAKAQDKVEEVLPEKDMLSALLTAAMECAGDEADEAAELLDKVEISRIDVALDSGGTYTPANKLMPAKFVECINSSIPGFFAIQEGTA